MALISAVLALLAAACGDDEPELTIEQRLELVEGRPLTPDDVDRLVELADGVCGLDDAVLQEVWTRLDDDQLAFQDFVFEHRCPDRSVLYGTSTGRYVTEEAEQVGGGPSSTTQPDRTGSFGTAEDRESDSESDSESNGDGEPGSGPSSTTGVGSTTLPAGPTTSAPTAPPPSTDRSSRPATTAALTGSTSSSGPTVPATTATIAPIEPSEGEGG